MGHDEQLIAGKYKLEESLGQGGMGRVDAAVNIYSGQRVALKRIFFARMVPTDQALQPELLAAERRALRDRLLKEGKALAQLDHPFIVRLLDCGPTEPTAPADDVGDIYIAMELVEGDSLRALIRRAKAENTHLKIELVLKIAARVAEAMDFAHIKKVYHRDLKPENIIVVTASGDAKVVDFGLAKLPATASMQLPGVHGTNPANVVGTPLYMSPEQVRGLEVDARTDIYALGVTIYEALTGRTPYGDGSGTASPAEQMGHACFAEATPLRQYVPSCSEGLSQIISRCLAKNPADRYSHMGSVARALRGELEEIALRDAGPPADALPEGEAQQAAPREERSTQPMPGNFQQGVVLPFAQPLAAPVPREASVTEPPPPPSSTPRPSLPFSHVREGASRTDATELVPQPGESTFSRSAIPPPPTTSLASSVDGSAASVTELGESTPSRAAILPTPSMPPSGAVADTSDPDDEVTLKSSAGPLVASAPATSPPIPDSGMDASGAGVVPPPSSAPASSAVLVSGAVGQEPPEQVASGADGSEPRGLQSGPGFAFESTAPRAEKEAAMQENPHQVPPRKRRRRRLVAYAPPLLVGLLLAVTGALGVMKVRNAAGGDHAAKDERARVHVPTAAPASASARMGEAPSEPALPAASAGTIPAALPTTVAPAMTAAANNAPATVISQRPKAKPPAEAAPAARAPTNAAAMPTLTASPSAVPPPASPPPAPPADPPPAPTVAPHRIFGVEQ